MVINTKFSTGEHAYLRETAQRGILTMVRVVTVRTTSEYGAADIQYQIYGYNVFNNTWYSEYALLTFLEAKNLAASSLNRTEGNTVQSLENLLGIFNPVPSTLIII